MITADLTSARIIKRHPTPVLAKEDVPFPATCIFNAGVCKFGGRYVMLFRNDVGEWGKSHFHTTNLGLAFSDDGIKWTVEPKPVWDRSDPGIIAATDGDIMRVYDPRLIPINGRCYVCFACDTKHGLRGGVAVTEDFHKFEVLSLSVPDNRNMVLFPEKIDGKYARLERPMPVYSRGGDKFDTWFSDSPDLRYWGNSHLVAGVEHFPYANDKIGPAAPPIKTKKGWLTTVHTVDRDNDRGKNGWEAKWQKRYCAGLMLLDLHEPWKIVGLSRQPLLAPENQWERDGFRNDVIFPGGMILEDSGEVKIYYGAADTYECLATAHVDDLLKLCEPVAG
ncbi:MAG TPA: glycoside hydrolase family 130 protein [Tepidisphaeraceae bacterium]|jgi:beta-1,4-mannooligosaccharide/beta-1,4-mannosyl-N-acetylglucosamine phosphorylase|nr:glycoside hydrolase family 130 protein [Tepidisphaeraceae bacterium]